MTPERMSDLVAGWVRFYTRKLSAPVALRRIEEIDADLHDHIAHERASGIGDWRIARGIASRMVRGLAADLVWRRRQVKLAARRSPLEESMNTTKNLFRSALRVSLGVGLVLSLPLVAMLFTEDVAWSLGDFAVAGVLLAAIGGALELAVRKARSLPAAIAIAVVGGAAVVFGRAGDAPGLVLLGILLIVSACALGVRSAQHSS